MSPTTIDLTSEVAIYGNSLPDSAGPAASELLWRAAESNQVGEYLTGCWAAIQDVVRSGFLGVVAARGGEWSALGATGKPRPLPTELLADALDREGEAASGNWFAAPLAPKVASSELLVAWSEPPLSSDARQTLAGLALVLGRGLSAVRLRQAHAARIRRLEAILTIAAQWNQTLEMESLLTQMAQASTRLLEADRASIFLWDKANKMLVGRPALGVENNELRIPDNAGIVGQVVQTGEPRRVDRQRNQEQINRQVDKRLGYHTETLLCVPLCGADGEVFGAFEVINKLSGKNFSEDDQDALTELASHAAVALENAQERTRLVQTRRQMSEQAAQGVQLIGESPAIEALRSTIRRVAATDLAVLILGENGTGKEVVSRSIHYLGPRRDEPFIAVNCAAITETLLESELFGHEKGAFTGAEDSRPGKFELASGGTLFLDEIGDMSPSGQAKMLRVLEEKVVVRVGGATPIHTDARVIAATNQNLADLVRQKKFRQDLFFRLCVVTLELPPLRERPEDILPLAEHFLREFCARQRKKPPTFSADAKRRLQQHFWPGNVRELRNLVERLAYLFAGETIQVQDLGIIMAPQDESAAWVAGEYPLAEATVLFQSEYIKKAIARCKGNMSDAAEKLGLHRSNLYRKMRQLGMKVEE
ncbi:MAG: sigma-54-dependent Fis family transcriptional regulator [Planctomycetia bacterium]|nr:sigma-54-dependent Fis family transcriptional regulator [Planctomycetia bacterium]